MVVGSFQPSGCWWSGGESKRMGVIIRFEGYTFCFLVNLVDRLGRGKAWMGFCYGCRLAIPPSRIE